MGPHPENPDKIEEFENSGLQEAILRDPEWSSIILKNPGESGTES